LRGRASIAALAFLICWGFWLDLSWAAVPVLDFVNPASIVKDSTGVSVAVQGSGFDSSTVVKWGVVSLSTTIYGTTQGVALVPDSLLTSVGVGVVTVENPDGVSNAVAVAVVDSISDQLHPILYVLAGLLGAWAFIVGYSTRL